MSLNTRIKNWQGRRVWIIGASTGIGAALAEALHERGAKLALSARRAPLLEQMAARFGGDTQALPLDITQTDSVAAAEAALAEAWNGYDLVIFMAGDYTAMRAWQIDLDAARRMVEINWMGYLNGLSAVVPRLLAAGQGGIALAASVAGYRGLPKGLVYGPTKAAVINLAESLYLDLKSRGLDIYLINPGFVKTPMTAQNDFKMPYLISPQQAAREIVDGFEAGEFEIHFPKPFTRSLKLLRHFSNGLYFKTIRKVVAA